MGTEYTDLGLTMKGSPSAGGCGGDSCACGTGEASAKQVVVNVSAETPMVEQTFDVTGMTCNNCVNHVTKAVAAVDGVCCVDIELNANGVSHVLVTSPAAVSPDAVKSAVEAAGYQLA